MKKVKRVEARWNVQSGQLFVTGIVADGKPLRTLAELPVERTGPNVIRIDDHGDGGS